MGNAGTINHASRRAAATVVGVAGVMRGCVHDDISPTTIRALEMTPAKAGSAIDGAACRGAFLVCGGAYSGSTLLNMLLGSHPQVAGGGELHWLSRDPETVAGLGPRQEKDQLCAICRATCPIWTAEVRQQVRLDNIYDVTAKAYGKPFVCDATKNTTWQRIIEPATPTPLHKIFLVKHPVRHIASYMEKGRRFEHMRDYAELEYLMKKLHSFRITSQRIAPSLMIRYEDMICHRQETFGKILGLFGLSFSPEIDHWRDRPHHHIGGNAGPRYQVAKHILPVGDFSIKKYDREDVFLDNSYELVLDNAQIDQITADVRMREYADWFGYDMDVTAPI